MEGVNISTPIGAYQCATFLLRIANVQRKRLQDAFDRVREGFIEKLRNEGEKIWEWRMDHQCNRLGVIKKAASPSEEDRNRK